MGQTVVADQVEKEQIMQFLTLSERAAATANGFTFTHPVGDDPAWAAALARVQASEPLPGGVSLPIETADVNGFNAAVDAAVAAYLAANPPLNSHIEWCEENGAIASLSYEWSYGNGATGTDIGLPTMVRRQLTHISLNSDAPGTSATINARRQGAGGTGSGTIVATSSPFTASSRVYALPIPQIFEVGEMLICQTGTVVGSWTDARVGFRFEEIA